jgi:hypothetical protein
LSDAGPLYVAFMVTRVGRRGALILAVEHSDDGEEWEEAASFTFVPSGQRSRLDQVSEPKDRVRVRWTIVGGLWNFSVDIGSARRTLELPNQAGESPLTSTG